MFKKTLVLAGLIAFACAGPNADADRVLSLPMMGEFDTFEFYSGYIPVTETRNYHYIYLTSQNNPLTDPVIFWFNGGPGCSSLLGWAQEHGPYVMESDTTTFHFNEYSWNTFANVVYLESPGGVGFSTCGSRTDCTYTDDSSAIDNFDAIVYWYETLFPEYQSNPVYITGESYAGIYVPYVFDLLATWREGETGSFDINLQGFAVGNGCTNWHYDTTPAFVEMAYWHGLYDDLLYQNIKDNDCESQYSRFATGITARCLEYLVQFEQLVADIDPYDVYGKCYAPGPTANEMELYGDEEVEEVGVKRKSTFTAADYTPWLFQTEALPDKKRLMELPPCTYGQPIIDYLNSAEVREALHIPANVQDWDLCTSDINYIQSSTGSQWVYEKWNSFDYSGAGDRYRMLHYSGDVDGSVPTYGTLQWIEEMVTNLGLPTETPWYAYNLDGQVAGYYVAYQGFDFASVHGAGHMVPQFKRPEAYLLFTNWFKGAQPPGF